MPPLFRKKPTTEVVPNKMKKTGNSNYLNKKSRVPFKTPLLSKVRHANFFKPNSEGGTANDFTSTGSISDHHTSHNTEGLHDLERENSSIKDGTLPVDSQTITEAPSFSVDNASSNIISENQTSNNQIVPTPINSPEMFESSGSTGQLTMNDPAIKGAYLDFLEKKNTSHSLISSQSSDYSINEPEMKKMYLDFMKSKTDTEKNKKSGKLKQPNKRREHATKKTNKNGMKNQKYLSNENKKINKSEQLNEKKNQITHSTIDENNPQKKPNTKLKNKKGNKLEVNNISHIDIKFSTTSPSKDSKNMKLISKKSQKPKQTKHSKKIISNKDSTKEPAHKETSKVIRSKQTFQTQKEKLEWVLEASNTGLYVICDRCEKTRYLEDINDPLELPGKWYCENNPDPSENSCIIPQQKIPDEVEAKLIENQYNAGSIVWAHLRGYPWWPAIVDVCPDVEEFFWLDNLEDQIPTWYNVTYFDTSSVTRSWLKVANIVPFKKFSNPNKHYNIRVPCDMSHSLEKSIEMAHEALNLPLSERLRQYSFIYRYNKPINKPQTEKGQEKATQKKYIKKKLPNDNKKKRHKHIQSIKSDDSDATILSNIFEFDIEPDVALQELF